MSILHVIEGEQAMEGPGIFLNTEDRSQFAVRPLRSLDGQEVLPFTWATEFPPLGDFVIRFSAYWRARRHEEIWVGGEFNPGGTYFARYHPFDQRSGR